MKKELLLAFLFCFSAICMSAQTLSLTGYGGYNFRDKINFDNNYGYLNAGGQWGISAEGIDRRGLGIELLYQEQSTHTPLYSYSYPDKTTVSVLLLNFLKYFRTGSVQPYGGIGLGAAFINNQSYNSETRFAFDAKAGVKFNVNSRIGIKVQAQLLSMLQPSGAGFYAVYDNPGGTSVTTFSYPSICQFGFSGGICFDLGKAQLHN